MFLRDFKKEAENKFEDERVNILHYRVDALHDLIIDLAAFVHSNPIFSSQHRFQENIVHISKLKKILDNNRYAIANNLYHIREKSNSIKSYYDYSLKIFSNNVESYFHNLPAHLRAKFKSFFTERNIDIKDFSSATLSQKFIVYIPSSESKVLKGPQAL